MCHTSCRFWARELTCPTSQICATFCVFVLSGSYPPCSVCTQMSDENRTFELFSSRASESGLVFRFHFLRLTELSWATGLSKVGLVIWCFVHSITWELCGYYQAHSVWALDGTVCGLWTVWVCPVHGARYEFVNALQVQMYRFSELYCFSEPQEEHFVLFFLARIPSPVSWWNVFACNRFPIIISAGRVCKQARILVQSN